MFVDQVGISFIINFQQLLRLGMPCYVEEKGTWGSTKSVSWLMNILKDAINNTQIPRFSLIIISVFHQNISKARICASHAWVG